MIDPRLSEPFFDTQVAQIESCEAWVAGNAAFPQAAKAVTDWFCDHVPEGQPLNAIQQEFGEGLKQHLEILPREDLPGIKLSSIDGDVAAGVDALITRQGDASPYAQWLVGTALAEACLKRSSNTITLATAWVIVTAHSMAREAFKRSLLSHDPSEITTSIENVINLIAEDPTHFLYSGDRAQFPLALKAFQEIKSVAVAWNFERIFSYPGLACPFVSLADIVREASPQRFLQLLENYKMPGAVSEELQHYKIRNDFNMLLTLLEESPTSFDGDNWNGKLVAPLIFTVANDFVFRLHHQLERNRPDEHEAFLAKEAPELLQHLFQVLLNRGDGLALGLSWLSEHIRQSSIFFDADSQDSPWNDLVMDTLVKSLYDKNPSLDQIQDVLSMPPDQGGFYVPRVMDILLTMCLITFEGDANTDDIEKLHGFYDKALDTNDHSLRCPLAGSGLSWKEYNIAKILVMRETPADAWQTLWDSDALCERRRRRQYYRYAKENATDYADTTHAHVGLAILDWLCSPEHSNPAEARSLWGAIFETQFFEYLTFATDENIPFMGNLFGRLPLVFQDLSSADTSKKIFDLFSRFSGDAELLSVSCLGLHLNNYDLKTCCDELRAHHGLDVRSEIQLYLDWANRDGGKPIRTDLPTQIQVMLKAIS